MNIEKIKLAISEGKTALGIELGSTRIKAVLIDENHEVIASGAHDWENKLENSLWTYSLDATWAGVQDAYAKMAANVCATYGVTLTRLGAFGVSGMMHGYMPFDKAANQLTAFRTWRNTNTEQAANELTKHFGFNVPQRWSIAHLYQAIIDKEEHVEHISYLTTLAGYIHWQITGERVVGVGEASGMFPINDKTGSYDAEMAKKFDAVLKDINANYSILDILPAVLTAGDSAGKLTQRGASLLDISGALQAGAPVCPPEGDAGTGMVATNSIAPKTGNVSAGTSVFAMIVLQNALSRVYTEIDMVTTPAGAPVAMVHCNTCTSDMDAWIALLGEMAAAAGASLSKPELYDLFYQKALEGAADCGGLINYNYFSGEPITGAQAGCPLFVRRPSAKLSLANFARAQIYSSVATLKIGMDILFDNENVTLDTILGHGGLFKTPIVGQTLVANALNTPLAVMQTASEGGPWGMAVLASYMLNKQNAQPLEQYLNKRVFANAKGSVINPDVANVGGFASFLAGYKSVLCAEKAAADELK